MIPRRTNWVVCGKILQNIHEKTLHPSSWMQPCRIGLKYTEVKSFAGYDLAPQDVQICSSPASKYFACNAPTEDRDEGSCDWNCEGKGGGRSNPMIKLQTVCDISCNSSWLWKGMILALLPTKLGEIQIRFYKLSSLVSGIKICNIRFNHWQ